MKFGLPFPRVTEQYYKKCGPIDEHNRYGEDTLDAKKKLGAKEWSLRVKTTLLSMCAMDAWLVYMHSISLQSTLNQSLFYGRPAEEVIDNTYGALGARSSSSSKSSR